jgi:hypothetical protein
MIALELYSTSKLDECVDFVWKAARNAGHGWDQGQWQQLEELKNRRKAAFISSLEPLFGPGGRTDQLGDMVQFSRDVDFDSREVYVFHELDKIGKFELADVGAALTRALDPSRARVTVFTPSKQGQRGDRRSNVVFHDGIDAGVEPPEVDPGEALRPLQVPAELKVFARATRFELGNGMRVVLLPVDAMPVVAAQLIFDAGDATASGNPVIARAAAQLLSLPLDSTVLGETGVEMGCSTTPDHTICRARGMSIYVGVVVKAFERLIKTDALDLTSADAFHFYVNLYTETNHGQAEFLHAVAHEIALHVLPHVATAYGFLNLKKDDFEQFKLLRSAIQGSDEISEHRNLPNLKHFAEIAKAVQAQLHKLGQGKIADAFYKQAMDDIRYMLAQRKRGLDKGEGQGSDEESSSSSDDAPKPRAKIHRLDIRTVEVDGRTLRLDPDEIANAGDCLFNTLIELDVHLMRNVAGLRDLAAANGGRPEITQPGEWAQLQDVRAMATALRIRIVVVSLDLHYEPQQINRYGAGDAVYIAHIHGGHFVPMR